MKKILVILSCLLFLVGCSDNSENNPDKEKIASKMEYVGSEISDLLHNLNNISLENYELISRKVSISQESSQQGGGSSSGGSSQPSSGGQGSGSSGGEEQGGQQSSGGQGAQTISVTEMQNKSVLATDTETIDWDLMRHKIENINTSWSVIMLDLYNNNVSSDDIIAFSNLLDSTIISIKNEDKAASLANLSNLYSYIPRFLTATSAEKQTQNIETTKYYIYTAYSLASQDDWNGVTENLSNAENNFLSILNDIEYAENKEFKINKTYMLLKDLQNSTPNNDKNLFFLKYKNLIESLNTL